MGCRLVYQCTQQAGAQQEPGRRTVARTASMLLVSPNRSTLRMRVSFNSSATAGTYEETEQQRKSASVLRATSIQKAPPCLGVDHCDARLEPIEHQGLQAVQVSVWLRTEGAWLAPVELLLRDSWGLGKPEPALAGTALAAASCSCCTSLRSCFRRSTRS